MLGLDEAGRGSVFGPLVVGGFELPSERLGELEPLGVRDSKLLTPGRRAELDRELRRVGRAHLRVVLPARIDRFVRRGELNALEARVFGDILRKSGAATAYVDACDPVEARFGAAVARFARVPSRRVIARHHADRDLPLVSAASIVAKVARDRALARLGVTSGRTVGSGYPSDPETRGCLEELLRGSEPLPDWVRASWATVRNLMPPAGAHRLDEFE